MFSLKPSKIYLFFLTLIFIVSLICIAILAFSIIVKVFLGAAAACVFLSSLYSDVIFVSPLPQYFSCLPGSKMWRYAIYWRGRCLQTNKLYRRLIFFDQLNNKEWKALRRHFLSHTKIS